MTGKFDVEAFEAFCRSKPADEKYEASDSRRCALARFGFPDVLSCDLDERGIPSEVYTAAIGFSPFTFSALADRLAKLRVSS